MDDDGFLKGQWRKCWVCDRPTRYVNRWYGHPIHRRCLYIADRAYWMTTHAGASDFRNTLDNARLYRFLRKIGRDAPE
jgi:hypothetical protein